MANKDFAAKIHKKTYHRGGSISYKIFYYLYYFSVFLDTVNTGFMGIQSVQSLKALYSEGPSV